MLGAMIATIFWQELQKSKGTGSKSKGPFVVLLRILHATERKILVKDLSEQNSCLHSRCQFVVCWPTSNTAYGRKENFTKGSIRTELIFMLQVSVCWVP